METTKKPVAKLSGEDGNMFAIMARAGQALKRAGMEKERAEMQDRVYGRNGRPSAKSYEEALAIVLEYVDDWDGENDPDEDE